MIAAKGVIGRVPKKDRITEKGKTRVIGHWVSTSRRVVRGHRAFNQKASEENVPLVAFASLSHSVQQKQCSLPISQLLPSRLPPPSSLSSQSTAPSPSSTTSQPSINKSATGLTTPALPLSPPSPPLTKTPSPSPPTPMTSPTTPLPPPDLLPSPYHRPPASLTSRTIPSSKPSRSLRR